ncbi:Store-operated calcium entry-associated regulatory factor [Podila epigama]|nr:Store-operated calcium entry-associated regulatory factor [Podila epigama]
MMPATRQPRSRTLTLALVLALSWASSSVAAYGHQKVLLRDVQTITLHQGRMTTGRRTSPVPQLNCIGGNACGLYEPDVVQCTNTGSNGDDVQWKCQADLPENVRFGQLDVYCEGYKNPDDPFVLKGSCGLEYKLHYTGNHRHQGYSWDDSDIKNWVNKVKRRSWMETLYFCTWMSIVGYILYSFVQRLFQPTTPRDDPPPPYRASSHGSGGGGGGGGGGHGGGWGSGWGSGHDHYHKPSAPSEGYRPGFWSGLGLGLATHLATNRYNNRRQYHDDTMHYAQQPSSSWGYSRSNAAPGPSSSSSSSSSPGATRTATGYGGTRSR